MIGPRYSRFAIVLSVCCLALIFLVACNEEGEPVPRPQFEHFYEDFFNGRPGIRAFINPNGTTIKDIKIHWDIWDRGSNPSQLVKTNGVYELDGFVLARCTATSYYQPVATWTGSDLPGTIDDPVDIVLVWNLPEPLSAEQKLVYQLELSHTTAEGNTLFWWSDRRTIHQDTLTEEGPCEGGVGDVSGGESDPPPDTELTIPVIINPEQDETCAGSLVGDAALVDFAWEEVYGTVNETGTYQLEIRRADHPSCADQWDGPSSLFDNSQPCWIADPNSNATNLSLETNTDYIWRVRASREQPDGTWNSGDWSAERRFTTAGPPGLIVLLEPDQGEIITHQNAVRGPVNFEWEPPRCGASKYHLIYKEGDPPTDEQDFSNLANAANLELSGTITSTLQPLETGHVYFWWVWAETQYGNTPLVTVEDIGIFTISDGNSP